MNCEIKYNSPLQYLDYDVSRYMFETYIYSNESRNKYNLVMIQFQGYVERDQLNIKIEKMNIFFENRIIYIKFLRKITKRKYYSCQYCDKKCDQLSHFLTHIEYNKCRINYLF